MCVGAQQTIVDMSDMYVFRRRRGEKDLSALTADLGMVHTVEQPVHQSSRTACAPEQQDGVEQPAHQRQQKDLRLHILCAASVMKIPQRAHGCDRFVVKCFVVK